MPADGVVEVSSTHTVEQTLQQLQSALAAHGARTSGAGALIAKAVE
jgi:hypothetical protein